MKKIILFFNLLWLLTPVLLQAQNDVVETTDKLVIESDGLPAKPPLSVQKQHSVYDYAKLLSPQERQMLEQKISKYYDSTSTQIVIATVNKLHDDISLYATEWAHKWGIGQKGKDNGVFILVSKDDHKVTINTGYGVEHLLTDALSKRIIEKDIVPNFRQGKFFEGLNEAIDDIIKVLAGEYVNDLKNDREGGIPIILIIIIIIFLLIILSNKGNSNGGWRSSGGGPIIFSSGGRSSWGSGFGGGSFGGGGFSGGFGGGGFGGGGASGSW